MIISTISPRKDQSQATHSYAYVDMVLQTVKTRTQTKLNPQTKTKLIMAKYKKNNLQKKNAVLESIKEKEVWDCDHTVPTVPKEKMENQSIRL